MSQDPEEGVDIEEDVKERSNEKDDGGLTQRSTRCKRYI